MMFEEMKVFAGSSHRDLANRICQSLGIPLGESTTIRFSNENLLVKIEENVRCADVFVVQTACEPLHEHIMELFILIDALKHASAARITAVIPYMPYVRSDKKDKPRISITARLMADLLETAGAHRVLLMDLHASQIQGFFRIPADQLMAAPIICRYLEKRDLSNLVLVAPDAGEVKDLIRYANTLNLSMAIIDKRRERDDENAKAVSIIGNIEGKDCLLIDDEIASGGTVVNASKFLKARGAARVLVACTHAVLSGQAPERLAGAPIEEVIVTDTVPLASKKSKIPQLTVLTVAPLFAGAIQSIHDGNSVSRLFEHQLEQGVLDFKHS